MEKNGTSWTKGLLAGVGLMVGLVIGMTTATWRASQINANLENHLSFPGIHETVLDKESRIRFVIDREVMPALIRMEARMARIERKLDESKSGD